MKMNFVSNRSGHVATATAPCHCHLLLHELGLRWRHLLAIKQRGAAQRSSCTAHACRADADADASNATLSNANDFLSAALSDEVLARVNALALASSNGAGAFSSDDDEYSAANASAASGSPADLSATKASLTEQAERRRARGSYELAKQAR